LLAVRRQGCAGLAVSWAHACSPRGSLIFGKQGPDCLRERRGKHKNQLPCLVQQRFANSVFIAWLADERSGWYGDNGRFWNDEAASAKAMATIVLLRRSPPPPHRRGENQRQRPLGAGAGQPQPQRTKCADRPRLKGLAEAKAGQNSHFQPGRPTGLSIERTFPVPPKRTAHYGLRQL